MEESRLFKILYYLLERKKTRVTAPELAKKFEVSVRTIYRDIDTLSSAGIPVYSTQGKGGGIFLLEGYVFDRGMISKEEQQTIIAALQSLSAVTTKTDNELLRKLGGLFNQNNPNWIQIDFSRWGNKKDDNKKFDRIKSAILNRQYLSFKYISSYGSETDRKVKPLKICYKFNSWYLQAYCTEKSDFRTFKINRILHLHLLPESFTSLPEPPPLEKVENLNKYPCIKMKFKKEIAYRVYDEFDEYAIQKQASGDLIVKTQFPIDNWLYGYLMSFCGLVEILEPEHVKNTFMEILREMYKDYIHTDQDEV